MKNTPKSIFLQIGEGADVTDFNEMHRECITWCAERINENDLEFELKENPEQLTEKELLGKPHELMTQHEWRIQTVNWCIINAMQLPDEYMQMVIDKLTQADPKPITPEMLEAYGFEKNDMGEGEFYYSLRLSDERYCDLALITGDNNGCMEVCLFPYEDFFRVRYEHQMLAMYKGITGRDLVAKNE